MQILAVVLKAIPVLFEEITRAFLYTFTNRSTLFLSQQDRNKATLTIYFVPFLHHLCWR